MRTNEIPTRAKAEPVDTPTTSACRRVRTSASLIAESPDFHRVDRSLQTDARAKPARPEDGIASDASGLHLEPTAEVRGLDEGVLAQLIARPGEDAAAGLEHVCPLT